MRVVTVTSKFPHPAEPFVVDRVIGLSERGVESVVVAEKAALAAYPDIRRRLQGRVDVRVPNRLRRHRRLPPLWTDPRADVVEFQHLSLACAGVDWLRRLRAATVVTCRGSEIRVAPLGPATVRDRVREVLQIVDRIDCVSAELGARCLELGAPPERLRVAPFGVDLRTFAPRSASLQATDSRVRILSVGRLHWVKGYDYALQAVRLLRNAGCDISYTIAGPDDGAGEAVRLAIHDLRLAEDVTLLGPLPPEAIRDVLAQSDIFLLSSVSEGLSQAVMEAMAMGVPVIVSDVGGMRELVDDGVHGRVVPPRDPAAIAAAIADILSSASGVEMGVRASEHIRSRYDREAQLDLLVQSFTELVAARPPQTQARSRRRFFQRAS